MPELPEVETIRKSLKGFLIGKTIDRILVSKAKQFIGDPFSPMGYQITDLTRHGKIMHWHLKTPSTATNAVPLPDGKDHTHNASLGKLAAKQTEGVATRYINIHLKMSGRLSYIPSEHTRVMFEFTDGSHLYFNDPRTFGWVKLTDTPEITKGTDVLSPLFTEEYFVKQVTSQSKDIKTVLLDQDLMAGIGNIYANDALWESQVNPFAKAKNISHKKLMALYKAIKQVIAEAIKHGGSSKTWVYRLPNGASGDYQNHFRVYDQEGKPCKRCNTIIKRISKNGRSSFMCPSCQ
jgi:formamidopyrimidine-DNA glycosylase